MAKVTKMKVKPGDILAIDGSSIFSALIKRADGGNISHVGMIIGAKPPIVIEALWTVKTRPLDVSIAHAEHAYILHDKTLTPSRRKKIVNRACEFSSDVYGFGDIALQGLDSLFRTDWFTQHLNFGLLNFMPVCSYLVVVAEAYGSAGLTFGKKPKESVTPQDIFDFAKANPDKYTITKIK